jgi:replicative DNA helicase
VKEFKDANDLVTSWCDERLFVFDDLVFIEDIERQVRETDRLLRERDRAAGVPEEKVRGLDFVIIDYLQLMATREKIRVREEMVSHMVRTCQRMFKQLDICGLVASQLNRKARDEDRRPKLSDLRESGAIEQDAVRVWFVHTPPNDSAGIAQTGERSIDEIELIQAKSRNGPRDIICDLLFYKKQARYEEKSRKGDVRPGAPKPAGGYKREGQS